MGYLIEKYKELKSVYDSYNERITKLENEIKNLPDYVRQLVYEQTAQLRNEVETRLNSMDDKIAKNTATVEEMKDSIIHLQTQYQILAKMILDLMSFVEKYCDKIGENVYQRLKVLIDEWSKALPPVVCPVDGMTEPLETCLNHIYNSLRKGLTAEQYDALMYSAFGYDNKRYIALYYDTESGRIFYEFEQGYMLSPFTGTYETIKNVIYKLAELHKKFITAGDYDKLKLISETYDGYMLTAYAYDWDNNLMEV